MTQLNRHIWKSSISVSTKVRLYKVYILPILLYCCDTWTLTKQLSDRIDAFDMWCLRKSLRIPYTHHVTNVEVRRVTPQLKKTDLDTAYLKSRRPIANLTVLSMLLEHLVAQQLVAYLNSSQLLPLLVCTAYRACLPFNGDSCD